MVWSGKGSVAHSGWRPGKGRATPVIRLMCLHGAKGFLALGGGGISDLL